MAPARRNVTAALIRIVDRLELMAVVRRTAVWCPQTATSYSRPV